ncbi:MAG: (deoxy)nucleoside triphosphate pyrophosphohydrolase [bacterium]
MRLVTAAIIQKENTVLLARRGPGSTLSGFWEFPGGKVEEGETPEQCLIRELEEELNISCRVEGLLCESIYTYDHGCFKILALHTEWIRGDLSLKDHDEVRFVPIKDLYDYRLLPADIPIARQLNSTF